MSREEQIDEQILERAKRTAAVLVEDGRPATAEAVVAQACCAVNLRQLERLCRGVVKREVRDGSR